MYPSFRPFYEWAGRTWVGVTVADSNWLFPAVEAVHIVALTVLLGAIIMLDMRLMGVTLRTKPVRNLYQELAPWTMASLGMMLVTGGILFASEAIKTYNSPPFETKMVLLAAAILFHYTLARKLANSGEGTMSPVLGKLAGVVSLVLWFGVGFAGRAIGFF
jgi:hypothetical protein